MRKHLKPFIFTALACTFLLGAGLSADAASKVVINDTNFSSAVKTFAEKADTNKDGYLSKKEASKITQVYFFNQYNIDSFKGIEYFTDMEEFYYRADYATDDYDDVNIYETDTASEIDLSGFKKLSQVTIDSRSPYLKTVNLQDCTNLKNVSIEGRREDCIDTLNLKGCTNLRSLSLNWTNVKKLNLSGYKKLTDVSVTDDREIFQTLNLKNCSNLESVYVSGDRLSKVKLKGAKNLEKLEVAGRSLKSLDLKTNTQLKELRLGRGTNTSSLDLSKNKKLTFLWCYQTELISLDLSNHPNLTKVDCHSNPNLEKLNVKGCRKLRSLHVNNTKLTKLNVKDNVSLRKLRCKNTNLTKLNLSNTKIRSSSALQCDPDVTVTYAK